MSNTKEKLVINQNTTFKERQIYSPDTNVIITGGVTVTYENGAVFADRSSLTLKDGSTVRINPGAMLGMSVNSLLDARDGILNMEDATCFFSSGSSFMLSDYPAIGGNYIAVYRYGDINTSAPESNENGDNDFNFKAGVSFEAPPKQVFTRNPTFQGKWLMPVAYPEWFCSPYCDDWSVPINKAIQFKNAGVVQLPKGFLQVKHSLIVNYGIELRGVGESSNLRTYNTFVSEDNENDIVKLSKTKEYTGTRLKPVLINPDNTGVTAFRFNCVILVNINNKIINALNLGDDTFERLQKTTDDNKITVKYENEYGSIITEDVNIWESNHPSPSTYIHDIYIDAQSYLKPSIILDNNGNPIKDAKGKYLYETNHTYELRGIFVAGGATFEKMNFTKLYQAIAWNYEYCDTKTVIRCVVSETSMPTEVIKKSNRYLPDEYDLPYMCDLGKLGDALCFQYNHIGAACINAVKALECGGGVIDGNIINADVKIENCKALSYCNNHMEEGAQLRIIQSAVNVSGNYMHKGTRPNIIISAGEKNEGSVVNLADNVIIYVQGYEYPSFKDYTYSYIDKEGKVTTITIPARESAEKITEYDIAIFESQDKLSDPDIAVQIVQNTNIISVKNSYRYWTSPGSFSKMHIYGLTFTKLLKTVEKPASKENIYDITNQYSSFNEYNMYSQILSNHCQILPFYKITDYSFRINMPQYSLVSDSPQFTHIDIMDDKQWNPVKIDDGLYWYYKPGYYRYAIQVYCDTDRGFGFPVFYQKDALSNRYVVIPNENSVAIEGKPTDYATPKSIVRLMVNLRRLQSLGNNFRVKLLRIKLKDDKTTLDECHFVNIPVCQSIQLIDCGSTISGFKWTLITDENTEAADRFYDISMNVEWYTIQSGICNAWVNDNPIGVNWKKGDVLYNIASLQSWSIKINK